VFLNLESNIQSIVLPQLGAEQLDYKMILTSLSRIHTNPHKISEVKDRLNKLTQDLSAFGLPVQKERDDYELAT
jgi:hypothetical protein